MTSSRTDASATVRPVRTSVDAVPRPLVQTAPYVEMTVEHPSLTPTGFGTSFFPGAVPYRADDEHRVFYWRSVLPAATPAPDRWTGLVATTDELVALTHGSSHALGVDAAPDGDVEVVVDGTVAGDSTTAIVSGYEPPDVALRHVTRDAAEVALPTETAIVDAGTRETFTLPRQTVVTDVGDSVETAPELTVRNPGERTLYHPAVDGEYRLFPSFGLALSDLLDPVAVPTSGGELDRRALAADLGVELDDQPYPVRVLWQAFAHTAFDPHEADRPALAQFPSGLLAVR